MRAQATITSETVQEQRRFMKPPLEDSVRGAHNTVYKYKT
jgi:hypothetical protein